MANSYNNPQAPKGMRIVFGIFMVIVYLIVGLLFILDVFNIDNQVISIVVGSILIVYGIWRGYRLYAGRQ
ncbi:MAG: hypothetical protein K2H86_07410 [Muribaculaceae bacterium]|nr:hypothetical protein [Muribaculaceae bacterium]